MQIFQRIDAKVRAIRVFEHNPVYFKQ